jgi:hypothetical protein
MAEEENAFDNSKSEHDNISFTKLQMIKSNNKISQFKD